MGALDRLFGWLFYGDAYEARRVHSVARAERALAQRAHEAARSVGDTRAMHATWKALNRARHAEMKAEIALLQTRQKRLRQMAERLTAGKVAR